MSKWVFVGDKLQLVEDQYISNGGFYLKKGETGTAITDVHSYISGTVLMKLDRDGEIYPVHSSRLIVTKRNEKEKERLNKIYDDRIKLMRENDINVGSTIKVKAGEGKRFYNVVVTKVKEYCFEGYRLKSNGERAGGTQGRIALFYPDKDLF